MSKPDEAKKPVLSSKVMQLKFMQRAQEKRKREEAVVETEKRDTEAQWVVESARSRCVVIAGGDPIGGGSTAAVGRLSFNKFNPETEKLQQEAEAREERLRAARLDPEGKGVSISDEALAAELAKRQKQRQQTAAGAAGAAADQILPLRGPGSVKAEPDAQQQQQQQRAPKRQRRQ